MEKQKIEQQCLAKYNQRVDPELYAEEKKNPVIYSFKMTSYSDN